MNVPCCVPLTLAPLEHRDEVREGSGKWIQVIDAMLRSLAIKRIILFVKP